ncbi:hypothetical protein V8E52_007591 [Russula decolorans]
MVAPIFLEHGAAIDSKTRLGETAMHLVSGRGNMEIARLLLEGGADLNTQNKFSSNSLSLALRYDNPGHCTAATRTWRRPECSGY